MNTDDKPPLLKGAIAKLGEETLMTVGEPNPFSFPRFDVAHDVAGYSVIMPKIMPFMRISGTDFPFDGYYLRGGRPIISSQDMELIDEWKTEYCKARLAHRLRDDTRPIRLREDVK